MKKMALILMAGVLIMSMSDGIFAKRVAPKSIKSVTYKGIVFKVNNTTKDMGKVFAYDKKSEKLLWEKTLYTVEYDEGLERDVQDVYIKSMKIKKGNLEVIDELDRKYELNPKSGDCKK